MRGICIVYLISSMCCMCASLCPKHTQLTNHVEIIERFLNKVLLTLIICRVELK